MVESWDGRVIGCLGDPALRNVTPNIDRFARKGVLFKNNYTTFPVCCPARANLWSGQYSFNCKAWNNHKGLEPGTPILRDVLEEHGNYVFAAKKRDGRGPSIGIGKHDYISGGHSQQNRVTAWTGAANVRRPAYIQSKPAVSRWGGRKCHPEDWVRCATATKFLKQRAKMQKEGDARPFFLYLSLTTPHPRFRTTKHWLSKVDYDAVSIPPKDTEPVHPVIRYQQISKAWVHGFDPDSVRLTRAIYYAMVAETDAAIGTVLDTVESLGLLENTHVIITADHGENNMEHELFYKMNMYESSVRTPLVIAGPGIQQGIVLDNPVSTVDLYPTILEMAGIPAEKAPNPLDGKSLMPLLAGRDGWTRDYAFSMFTGTAVNTSIFMIRKDRWKYVAYTGYPPQLFDIIDDPDEINNVASKHPDVVKALDALLHDVCDYDAVHAEWQAYCKQAFRAWRDRVREKPVLLFEYGAKNPRATYEDVMSNTYKGWNAEDAEKLEKWLES